MEICEFVNARFHEDVCHHCLVMLSHAPQSARSESGLSASCVHPPLCSTSGKLPPKLPPHSSRHSITYPPSFLPQINTLLSLVDLPLTDIYRALSPFQSLSVGSHGHLLWLFRQYMSDSRSGHLSLNWLKPGNRTFML